MQAVRAYFDHAATSPMPQSVRDVYLEALQTLGNPASAHTDGQNARAVLETARETLARGFGVTSSEVVFTSGGTEAINLALKGIYWQRNQKAKRPVLLIAEGEHHATIEAAQWLEQYQGAEISWVPLADTGLVTADALEKAIVQAGAERIALFSVLWANNEIGTVQPVHKLCALAREYGIPTHVDAVAALGQFSLRDSGAAAMSVSAHKIGGPVSSGALLLARDQTVQPLLHGGSQQRARSGTQDAAAATAFAAAYTAASTDYEQKIARLWQIQTKLITAISGIDPGAVLRGAKPVPPELLPAGQLPPRIYNNVHFTFPGLQGDSLLFLLDMAGVSVATGSACTAGVSEVSHVMLALGLNPTDAAGALRFSFNEHTSDAEVNQLLAALPAALAAARNAGFTTEF